MHQSSQWRTGHINQLAIHRCCGLQALAQQRAETLRLGPSNAGLGPSASVSSLACQGLECSEERQRCRQLVARHWAA